MLFQKLYNWIKYKTLPSSYFFKNRLFIEREGRYKRVLNNFGLVFRNAKWANYELSNIKLKFKVNYFYYIFWIVLFFWVLLLTVQFWYFYLYSLLFNSVLYYIWLCFDTIVYYLSFSSWIILILFSNLVKWLFSNLFMQTLTTYADTSATTKKTMFYPNKPSLFYIWFTNNNSSVFINNLNVLEKVFETKLNPIKWNFFADYFAYLYKTVFLLNLINHKSWFTQAYHNFSIVNNKSYQLNNVFSVNDNNFTTYLSLYLYKSLVSQKTNKRLPITTQFDLAKWSLGSLIFELNNSLVGKKWKNGNFYLYSSTNINYYNTYYLELLSLTDLFTAQLNIAKQNRWLYKYSLLHRNLFSAMVNITTTKKLLNSGFYSISLFNKNLWGSETFTVHSTPHTLFNLYNTLFYNDLFNIKKNTYYNFSNFGEFNTDTLSNLLLLKNYEVSYFWFVKRSYFFETLYAHSITHKLNLMQNINFFEPETNSLKFNLYKSYFFKYPALHSLSFKNNILPFHNKSTQVNTQFLNKDLFLIFQDNDVLNKPNLDLLYWITLNPFSGTYHTKYYNYCSYSVKKTSYNTYFVPSNSQVLENLSYHLILTSVPTLESYKQDLYYFMFL